MIAHSEKSSAAVLTAFGEKPALRAVPLPTDIESGALLVEMDCATVCGTDVHMWTGAVRPKLPVERGYVLGHECVGRIMRFGADADVDSVGTPLELGDRIIWTGASCGRCLACTVWLQPGLCTSRLGPLSVPVDTFPYLTGAFAEHAYVHPRSARIRVPDDIPSTWASAASCALRTAVHAVERVGQLNSTDIAVVQGSGPIGLFCVALLAHAGLRVIVIGGPDNRLQVAGHWGADHCIAVETTDADERASRVRRITAGHGADIVIEASGARSAFGESITMARPSGRIALVGSVTDETSPIAAGLIAAKHLSVFGVWSARIDHYRQALNFLARARSRINFDLLLTGTYDLGSVSEALAGMASGAEIKPVIQIHTGIYQPASNSGAVPQ